MTFKILVLHGPNLNALGSREPALYGNKTLAEIDEALLDRAAAAGATLTAFQSNHEGVLIDRIHAAREEHIDFIVINPAAFTHTSIALRDALASVAIPFIEVHLSNVYRRETFRQLSYFSALAEAVICGMGWHGYLYAVDYGLSQILNK